MARGFSYVRPNCSHHCKSCVWKKWSVDMEFQLNCCQTRVLHSWITRCKWVNCCGSVEFNTTAYHPQTDGLVERFNHTLIDMLAKRVERSGRDWDTQIPYVLFAYRASLQESTGESPFFRCMGEITVYQQSCWWICHPLDNLLILILTKEKLLLDFRMLGR